MRFAQKPFSFVMGVQNNLLGLFCLKNTRLLLINTNVSELHFVPQACSCHYSMSLLCLSRVWAPETMQLLFGTRALLRSLHQSRAGLDLEAAFKSHIGPFLRDDDVDTADSPEIHLVSCHRFPVRIKTGVKDWATEVILICN